MPAPPLISLLFIDDDAGYVAVAEHLLSTYQGAKFSLVWMRDGASALEYLETHQPVDILVIDYFLQGTNGLEVTKQIRARDITIPIVFLTSHRDFRLAIEVLKYGVEDYLIKDEAVDTVLPRTILAIIDRLRLKKQIAEQQKAEIIAQQQTQAIKELVVTVCHEFNNPLAAIKISTDILTRQTLPEEEKAAIRELDANIGRVERLVTRLRDLNFEKIDFHRDS